MKQDKIIKVAFIGDNGVGKTMLFMRINKLIHKYINYYIKSFFMTKLKILLTIFYLIQ